VGIDGDNLIGAVEVCDEELISQFVCCVALHIAGVCGISDIHLGMLLSKIAYFIIQAQADEINHRFVLGLDKRVDTAQWHM